MRSFVHDTYMNGGYPMRSRPTSTYTGAYMTSASPAVYGASPVGQMEMYPENYMDTRAYPYSFPQYPIPMIAAPTSMPVIVDNSSCTDSYSTAWDYNQCGARTYKYPTPNRMMPKLSPLPAREEFTRASEPEEAHLYGPGPPIITGNRVRGPKGANLFCFHLPNEMTNWDLYLLFRRFGTILSVHTMINKQTGLSRGFGFVSFQEPAAAEEAMKNMNGYRIGAKRLKVQHKRDIDDYEVDDEMMQTNTTSADDSCYSSFDSPPYLSNESTPYVRSPVASAPNTPIPPHTYGQMQMSTPSVLTQNHHQSSSHRVTVIANQTEIGTSCHDLDRNHNNHNDITKDKQGDLITVQIESMTIQDVTDEKAHSKLHEVVSRNEIHDKKRMESIREDDSCVDGTCDKDKREEYRVPPAATAAAGIEQLEGRPIVDRVVSGREGESMEDPCVHIHGNIPPNIDNNGDDGGH